MRTHTFVPLILRRWHVNSQNNLQFEHLSRFQTSLIKVYIYPGLDIVWNMKERTAITKFMSSIISRRKTDLPAQFSCVQWCLSPEHNKNKFIQYIWISYHLKWIQATYVLPKVNICLDVGFEAWKLIHRNHNIDELSSIEFESLNHTNIARKQISLITG